MDASALQFVRIDDGSGWRLELALVEAALGSAKEIACDRLDTDTTCSLLVVQDLAVIVLLLDAKLTHLIILLSY